MSIAETIAFLTFGLSCFCAGYKIGKDINKKQKITAPVSQTKRLFSCFALRANRLSVTPVCICIIAQDIF